MAEVSDQRGEITIPGAPEGPMPLFWRSAPVAAGAERPTPVYLHGVPTTSDDWLPFLERTGGLAPDLPGFGRSGKPGYLDYTIDEYDRFLERFLDDRGLDRSASSCTTGGRSGSPRRSACPSGSRSS